MGTYENPAKLSNDHKEMFYHRGGKNFDSALMSVFERENSDTIYQKSHLRY